MLFKELKIGDKFRSCPYGPVLHIKVSNCTYQWSDKAPHVGKYKLDAKVRLIPDS